MRLRDDDRRARVVVVGEGKLPLGRQDHQAPHRLLRLRNVAVGGLEQLRKHPGHHLAGDEVLRSVGGVDDL